MKIILSFKFIIIFYIINFKFSLSKNVTNQQLQLLRNLLEKFIPNNLEDDKNPSSINEQDNTINNNKFFNSNEKTLDINLNDVFNNGKSQTIDLSNMLERFHPLNNHNDECLKFNEKCEENFLLSKMADGKFILIPTSKNGKTYQNNSSYSQNSRYENATNRQSLQVMSLAQALYSPNSPDKNVLNLNLKGRDGKQGKRGKKGPIGKIGNQGPLGTKGNKGAVGSCEMEIISMDQCSQDSLDLLGQKVDNLEKICQQQIPASPISPITSDISSDKHYYPSCQSIFEQDKDAKSGSYWLMVQGIKFKVFCQMDKYGWTLVSRINGLGHEFSPVSNLWTSKSVLDIETSDKIHLKTTMKNHGWFLVANNAIKICLSSSNDDCAIMTHSMGIVLSQLFLSQWGVTVDENWNFTSFMNALGKSCDTQKLKKQWCGLNLANICHPEDADPNLNPTNHIVRIGCIGSETESCSPADFAFGVGVSSCFDGYECDRVGPATPNLHWACNPFYGSIDQTAYIYVS